MYSSAILTIEIEYLIEDRRLAVRREPSALERRILEVLYYNTKQNRHVSNVFLIKEQFFAYCVLHQSRKNQIDIKTLQPVSAESLTYRTFTGENLRDLGFDALKK